MNTLKTLVLLTMLCTLAPICLTAQGSSEKAVRAVLDAQVQAWNAGKIEDFMQGYWQSDSLRFASGGNVQRGWQMTLERYKKGYPDKTAMGKLTFSNLETSVLSTDAVLVFGKWELQREQDKTDKDRPHGLFTLTFRKMAQGWKIIHDHTSSGN